MTSISAIAIVNKQSHRETSSILYENTIFHLGLRALCSSLPLIS